ncbi:hypothetical protein CKO_04664 [Citrobacter koseri ATCC BAA-895]|uniref:Uncharacterized protein n=1 Tax=Citrobacter koseri (strain ATCC BAA-895 / CDC 4225-83 / SGSC4696) TaxID=290338 RepID=A8AQF1_CITK8|nr:hypothetical protein CKO_04664 [Citrobacter koseri ATCC BAA-895]
MVGKNFIAAASHLCPAGAGAFSLALQDISPVVAVVCGQNAVTPPLCAVCCKTRTRLGSLRVSS